jgi:hypothetical protein
VQEKIVPSQADNIVPTVGMGFDGIDFDNVIFAFYVLFACIVQNSKSVDIIRA